MIAGLVFSQSSPVLAKDGDSGGNSGKGGGGGSGSDDSDDRDDSDNNSGGDDRDDSDDDSDDDNDDREESKEDRSDAENKKRDKVDKKNRRNRSEQDGALAAVRSGQAVPLQRVLNYCKSNFAGKVLDVKLKQRDKQYVYEVRVLSPTNFVRFIRLDAKSLKKL